MGAGVHYDLIKFINRKFIVNNASQMFQPVIVDVNLLELLIGLLLMIGGCILYEV